MSAITVRDLWVEYGDQVVLERVNLDIASGSFVSIVGPSGCGKSTFLRTLNRMNDIIPGTRVAGKVLIDNANIYGPGVDVVALRRQVGMVFQKSNPFPKSIFENIAYGVRLNRLAADRSALNDIVEDSLRSAALWDEVKDRLHQSALGMSGGQQQRLCIARAIAADPEVLLMDEPCSALDPIATGKVEELMHGLKGKYTIVIVTHNMQQAARVADMTAFFSVTRGDEGQRTGILVEYDATSKIFTQPSDKRTEDYVTGRFG